MTFETLGLQDKILRALADAGYSTPTPIQDQAIPVILQGRDVLGCAQTGTGKTASFTLPMIEILSSGRRRAHMPRCLILTPTRELATQVEQNFKRYTKYMALRTCTLVGGLSMGKQVAALKQDPDVLIATPGRLIDLVERGQILMAGVKILILDECDRMLDMGFIPDVEQIIGMLPPIRQTLMFSATMSDDIRKLSDRFLMNQKEITIAPETVTTELVDQFRVNVAPRAKLKTLASLIEQEDVGYAFVFCNRKRDIESVRRKLTGLIGEVGVLHGDISQIKRNETMQAFKAKDLTLLVCSDVAARGLDVKGLTHVFNYDVPTNPEDYVHRIGRTGRAGQSGRAFTLVGEDDDKYLQQIESLTGQTIPIFDVVIPGKSGKPPEKAADSPERGERPDHGEHPERGERSNHGEPTAREARSGRESRSSRDDRFAYQRDNRAPMPPDVVGFGDDIPAFMLQGSGLEQQTA